MACYYKLIFLLFVAFCPKARQIVSVRLLVSLLTRIQHCFVVWSLALGSLAVFRPYIDVNRVYSEVV